MSDLSLAQRGFVHGRQASMTITIPGLKDPSGSPLEVTEVYEIDEVGDMWLSARPLDDENVLVFGEHPLALFEITKLVLCPQADVADAVNPLVRAL